MEMRILTGADVRAAVDMASAMACVRRAFVALSAGEAEVPLRLPLETDHGVSLFMPAWLPGEESAGAKIVSVNPGNRGRGLPAIHAAVLLLEPETGRPRALLDGTWLTALRTGAAGGVAADLLARPDARVAAVFGAGVQARTQLQALREVRDIGEVRLVSRTGASARRWAEALGGLSVAVMYDPEAAVRGADVVIAATDSPDPVFPGAAVDPGTHVTGVGSYTPSMREVDTDLVRRARVFVDQREAVLAEAGDLAGPVADGDVDPGVIVAELGEVAAGRVAGRTDPEEITFFKSVGNAVQDVAVAWEAVEVARARGLGTVVEL
jgi:ornithine cyclodeaminase